MGYCSKWLYCFLFAFLLFEVNSLPPNPCIPEHSSALLQFKNSLSIGNESDLCIYSYPKTESWNETTDCCSWEGVTCHNKTGRVIGLDLSCSRLKGSLVSSSSLFFLEDLQWLNLAHLDLLGSQVSSQFCKFKSLTHLNLSHTGFHGLVTGELSLLSELVSLDFSSTFLQLDNHNFNMLVHNLSKLETLVLDNVEMSLVKTDSFLNLTSSLKFLSLSQCQLQGKFPTEIFKFPNLEKIILSKNGDLTGQLPESIGNLENLEKLDLHSCNFTGSIPSSLGNLSKITFLSLADNSFNGQIPDVFENLNELIMLDFSYNNFNGFLPFSAFNLTRLTYMNMGYNQFGGPLPYNISSLSNLRKLDISSNLLNGSVPGWLFSLPSLQSVRLFSNKFTGPIDHIPNPNLIEYIDLSNNEISGPIPSSFFQFVNLAILDLSSNNLSGNIESAMLSELRNLEKLYLSDNSLLSLSQSNSNGVNSTFPELSILSFSSCNINQFPSFLRQSKTLYILDLSNNKIQGSISKWEAQGWEGLLYLNLSFNLLNNVEQIPGKNLQILDLRSNSLQGSLPIPPKSIQYFFISKNQLTGEIPSEFCNLSYPQALDLSKNNLSGLIPECLGDYRYISVLDLQKNNFHGQIPRRFCSLQGRPLRSLNLNDNNLEGSMPQSLMNCSKLEVLDVGNNNLNDTFPYWLGQLPKLQVLVLRSNKFHGSIPNWMSKFSFTSLQVIDVSTNEFNGNLPTKFMQNLNAMKDINEDAGNPRYIGELYYYDSIVLTHKGSDITFEKILDIFTAIDFSNNQFQGQVPEVLGQLKDLKVLNLSHNRLTGQIPLSMGNLQALESLDLSSNQIEGRIPIQLTNLGFLAMLNLSLNNLEGPIPRGPQFQTFPNDSYIGNSRLCGIPLSRECNQGPRTETLPSISDEDDARVFDWKFAAMGYGCGLVFGLSMGFIVFTAGKSHWLVKKFQQAPKHNVRRQSRKGRKK